MDLNKQIMIWEKQGNWNKIIKAIEKLSPSEQTPALLVELAACYINRTNGYWSQRKSLEKALDILWGINEAAVQDDYMYYFCLGNALYNLNQWTRAFSYFHQALQCKVPKNSKRLTKMLMNECEKNILKPEFKQPFASRVKQAWEEFEKIEANLRASLSRSRNNYWNITTELDQIFKQAVAGGGIDLEVEAGQFELTFHVFEGLLKLFELQYIINHAPESVKKNWKLTNGFPLWDEKGSTAADRASKEKMLFEFKNEKDGVFTFDVKSEEDEPSEEDEDEDWDDEEDLSFISDWMIEIVGAIPTEKYFRLAGTIKDTKGKKLMPMTQMREFLQEKGIDIFESTRNLLDKKTSYTRTPMQNQLQNEYREDIEWGWTKCAKVLQDYENDDNGEAISLEADGSAVGCLFYRTDNFNGPDKEQKLEEFRELLKKTLTDQAGKDAFEVIGEAHGTNFDYLDILGWDIQKVLRVAFEFFKGTDVPFSGYHPLRKNCGSVRLTGENKWIPYRKPGTQKILNPREKPITPKTVLPPIEVEEDVNPLLASFWEPKDTPE